VFRHRVGGAVLTAALLVGCSGGPAVSPTPAEPVTSQSPTPVATSTTAPTATAAPPATATPAAPTAAASASLATSTPPQAQTLTFDDGALTIDVPAGALPPGVELSAVARGPDERPPELAEVSMTSNFYQLEPDGLTFAEPVTITRRVAWADLAMDPDADGLPIINLALRTTEGAWNWLDDQSITADRTYIYVSGKASHTSRVLGFGGANRVQADWSTGTRWGDYSAVEAVPVDRTFALHATITAPLDAPTPPMIGPGDPFPSDGLSLEQSQIINSPGWADLTQNRRSDAFPQAFADFKCTKPTQEYVVIGYEVVNIGAGSQLWSTLSLDPPSTMVNFGTGIECTPGSAGQSPSASVGSSPPASIDVSTPTSGCVIVIHTALGDFVSHLKMELGFGDAAALRKIEVTIKGANNGQPVVQEATGERIQSILLGISQAGPKVLQSVKVTTADGMTHDVTAFVASLLGGAKMDVRYPQQDTFGICPSQ